MINNYKFDCSKGTGCNNWIGWDEKGKALRYKKGMDIMHYGQMNCQDSVLL